VLKKNDEIRNEVAVFTFFCVLAILSSHKKGEIWHNLCAFGIPKDELTNVNESNKK
jgi:hypothetical protein